MIILVRDIVVPFEDLGDAKPSINQISDCAAEVTTYSQPQVRNRFVKFLIVMDWRLICLPFKYDWSPADANSLYSAKVIKAKFKIEDTVRESLCLGEAARNQCRDINQQAFLTALELASQVS